MNDAMIASNLETVVLSAAELGEIDAEIAHAPNRAAVAIDALKIVQRHRGWVSDASLRALADHLEMSPAELDSIATFYSLIFRQPVGERVILVCDSITCWVKGCQTLQASLSRRLGIKPGQTTPDNRYTLLPASCLGACDKAPVVMVGDDLFEQVSENTLGNILAGAKGGS